MRIVIITQDDPFYLPKNLDFLFDHLPIHARVIGCVVTKVSPFGKRESFFHKAKRTVKVFGIRFFLRYSLEFVATKLPLRPSVKKVLTKHGIPVIPVGNSLNTVDSLRAIESYKPDLLISIAGNEIFKRPLIELAPLGCLNVHTALLPKYRGLMPSFWVLKNRERETGVSVFYVDEGIDSGPILVQERIMIDDMSQRELIVATKHLAMNAIIKAIEKINDGDSNTLPNDDALSTYFSFPTKCDVIEFRKVGAKFF